MRFEGTLAKWNDDRGVGFITPTLGGDEVFVHISAFPRLGRRPLIGEQVSFEVETDAAGKKRAKHLQWNDHASLPRRPPEARPVRRQGTHWLRFLFILACLLLAGLYVYHEYRQHLPRPAVLAVTAGEARAAGFRCDGRTRCSQMRSCAEARFFLQHCPHTTLGGDHDGEPCSRQWCRRPSDT